MIVWCPGVGIVAVHECEQPGLSWKRTSPSASSTVGEDVAVFCLEGRHWPGTIMPAAAGKAL